ncbi:unnamed protein product [Dovyalis caffra]|uniref:Uncharacterized protein n=1 Tax=Dovyalis caffra TaxID=77055 RepID=A0AAV1QWM2_9ROSI|nr:unnamed protein product [Dovyalis caffra]
MDVLHKIAKAYYETATRENKDLGQLFFKSMDQDGDGQVSLHEFLSFMKNEGHIEMARRSFFEELNKNGSGKLDFMEANMYTGIKKFLDNYVLLETKRLDALKEKKAAKKKQKLEAEKQKLEAEKQKLLQDRTPIPVHGSQPMVVYNPRQGNEGGPSRSRLQRSHSQPDSQLCHFFKIIFPSTLIAKKLYPRMRPTRGEEINHAEKCSFHDEDEMKDEGSVESLDTHYCRAVKSRVFDENSRKRMSSKGHSPSSEKPLKTEHLEMTRIDGTSESRRGKLLKKHRISSPHGETKANKSKTKSELGENELLPESENIEFVPRGFARASEKSKRAIHAARMFKPKNPSFMVMLQRYTFYNHFLYVPLEFAQRHMIDAPRCIKLQVSDGREWPIQINRNQCRYLHISKGWYEFSKENNLKKGDVCVFELINKKKFVLKVEIFRESEANVPSD